MSGIALPETGESIGDLDEADKMIVAGLIKLALGVGGTFALEGLAAASTGVAFAGAMATAGLVAAGPVILVAGVYALSLPSQAKNDLFSAVSKTNDAVNLAHRPDKALKEFIKKELGAGLKKDSPPKPRPEPPTTKHTAPLRPVAKQLLKDLDKAGDKLLQLNEPDVSPDVHDSAPSKRGLEDARPGDKDHPMCSPDAKDAGPRREPLTCEPDGDGSVELSKPR